MGPQFVISVWNCRAIVSRRVDLGVGRWSYESAENWEELEDRAIDEVEDFGGAVNMSALYPCSFELAERAEWSAGETDPG